MISRFKKLAAGKAALFVTHNVDNARIADRVIVLAGGRVAESGTFEELLDSGGALAELCKLSQGRRQAPFAAGEAGPHQDGEAGASLQQPRFPRDRTGRL
ncbi:hypothetical protein GTW43_13490 [Streptomyces sp. SID5785]|uniref:ABC transporter ATP-binding protein n=1 Tax=Streptomyces sp. SID5785 TaxID=2690309 RepID=UPI0013618207|nr:ABC transporter ATP-binding protein [Streptomyces sp. SID5785]MZD06096.1 hypothetical protein [Streptomyces sp. SID5785]